MGDFSFAIQLDPTRIFSFSMRGRVQYAQGKFDQAAANYADSIKRKPTLLFAYDWLSKSLFHQERSDNRVRIQKLHDLITKYPN